MTSPPAAPSHEPLSRALAVLADDLLLSVLSAGALDDGVFEDLARRRAQAYDDAVRGHSPPTPLGAEPAQWMPQLARDVAPSCPPVWLPMHELMASGITLASGPRGVRSLFSSKPSEKEVTRVRRVGGLAARALLAALSSDAPLTADERLLARSFIAALGLPAEDEAILANLGAIEPAQIEVLGELEPKTARLVVQGAYQAAIDDGLDAREEGALAVLASRLGLKVEELGEIGTQARAEAENRRLLGRAAVDSIFWVLGDVPALSRASSTLVTQLLTPQPDRGAVLAALAHGAPPADVARSPLPRPARAASLAAAWAMALRTDPSFARRSELAARHDRVADVLGGDGAKVRAQVEALVVAPLNTIAAASIRKQTLGRGALGPGFYPPRRLRQVSSRAATPARSTA